MGKTQGLQYRWIIFLILSLQYLFVYFHRVCPAVVAQDLVEAFSINATSLGVLASGYFYPYAIMQIPVGLLSDSLGPRKTVSLFSLLAAAGAFIFALSPNFGIATLSRVIVGLGLSAVFVPTMKALAQWFRPGEYARISGVLMAVGGIGWLSAASPLALVSKHFGWRTGFAAIGCITITLAILTWFFVVDSPGHKGCSRNVEPPEPRDRNEKTGLWAGMKMVLSSRRFWPLAVWCFLNGSIIFSFCGLWAGPYLKDVYGLSKPAIGNILAMVALGMVVGSPFLGYLSDKILKSRKKVLVGCSLVTAIEWSIFYLHYDSLPMVVLYVFFLLIGVCIGSSVIIAFTAAKELFPLAIAGTSVSCVNLFGFVGGVIYQPLIGCLLDRTDKIGTQYAPHGYQAVMLLLFATSISFLLSTFLIQEGPKN